MSPSFKFLTSAFASILLASTAQAQITYTRQDNGTTLFQAGAWSGGGPPTSADIALWNSTSAGNYTTAIGNDVSWGQIQIVNPGGAINVNATASRSLTLNGTGGLGNTAIDMSAATRDLTIAAALVLSDSVAATQSWNIATGRTLIISGGMSGPGGIVKTGGGWLQLSTGTNTFEGGLSFSGGGRIELGSNGNAFGTGLVTLGDQTQLRFSSGSPTLNYANDVKFTGGQLNLTRETSGTPVINWNGNVELGGNLTYNSTDSTTSADSRFNGDISDGGNNHSLNFIGGNAGNRVTLAGNNDFGGGVTLNMNATAITYLNSANALGSGKLTITASSLDNNSGGAITLATNNPQDWNSNITFIGTNNLNMGTGTVTINANRIVTTTAGILAVGGIAQTDGTRSLAKAGDGTLVIQGTSTYTGNTIINAGVLDAVDGVGLTSGSGILQLRGGVFQSSGTFDRNVNAAAGAGGVNWATSSGGFAARGGDLILNLNGGTGSLTWNGSSMVSDNQTLIFGSTSADSLVDWQNALNLGSGTVQTRTIRVIDNPDSTTDIARISGNLTNTTAGMSLAKEGDGTLQLAGSNSYTGTTTVNAGTLEIAASGSTAAASGVIVNNDAKLIVNGTLGGTLIAGANATVSGEGTIAGNASIRGIHRPGNSPGIQTFLGELTYGDMNTDTTVVWELVANTTAGRGTNFDGINVGGTLNFADATTLDLVFNFTGSGVNWNNPFWDNSQLGTDGWLIYSGATSITDFTNFSIATDNWLDGSGQLFNDFLAGSYFNLFTANDDIYLNFTNLGTPTNVIPEPGSTLAICLLLSGCCLVRSRRRA